MEPPKQQPQQDNQWLLHQQQQHVPQHGAPVQQYSPTEPAEQTQYQEMNEASCAPSVPLEVQSV